MIIRLYKLSAPSKERTLDSEKELHQVLYDHVCTNCLKELRFEQLYGEREYLGIVGEQPDERFIHVQPCTIEQTTIDILLGTACGCEFFIPVEDDEDEDECEE